MDDHTLLLLEDIQKIEARQVGFTVIIDNGIAPNLLQLVKTNGPIYLENIGLTDKEKKLLNKKYPTKRAIEILGSLGFGTCMIVK